MDREIIYYLWNQNKTYWDFNIKSAKSVKKHMPDIPIRLWAPPFPAYEDKILPYVDNIEYIKPPSRNDHEIWPLKLQMLANAEADQVMFFDSDTLMVEPIYELFEMLDQFDLVVTLDHHYLSAYKFEKSIPLSFPELNYGMFLYRTNQRMRDFFVKAKKLCASGKKGCDQPFLRAALYDSDVRYAIVPWEYNCRYHFPGYLYTGAKIFHSTSPTIEQDAELFNKKVYEDYPPYKRVFTSEKLLYLKKRRARTGSPLRITEEITYREGMGHEASINKDRGDVLVSFIKKMGAERVAEVGVWEGATTRKILQNPVAAKLIKEYWAIDQWAQLNGNRPSANTEYGKMAVKTPKEWHAMYLKVCRFLPFFPQLKVMRSTSLEAAELFRNKALRDPQYFDLIFIDGDHYYEDVKADILAWKSLIRKGGYLCGHDYGAKNHPGVKKAVDETVGGVLTFEDNVWVKQV